MKTTYEHLLEMVALDSVCSFKRSKGIPTPRLQYIINEIKKCKVEPPVFQASLWKFSFDRRGNLSVYFTSPKAKSTIAFCAHHDIVNPKADNVFDNTTSVCHLISLVQTLSKVDWSNREHNILILFTDGEEVGGQGARHISQKINDGTFGNVEALINLELTARGKYLWLDNSTTISSYLTKVAAIKAGISYITVGCPFNDAVIFNGYDIDASCIGLIRRSAVGRIKNKRKTPRIWRICHRQQDSLHLANEEDISVFTNFLPTIATGNWTSHIKKVKDERNREESKNTYVLDKIGGVDRGYWH